VRWWLGEGLAAFQREHRCAHVAPGPRPRIRACRPRLACSSAAEEDGLDEEGSEGGSGSSEGEEELEVERRSRALDRAAARRRAEAEAEAREMAEGEDGMETNIQVGGWGTERVHAHPQHRRAGRVHCLLPR
jgi:hypothetical protein